DSGPPVSMQRRRLGPEVDALHAQLESLLPNTEYARELRALLLRVYRADSTVADAYADLLAFLFDRFGLLLTSSAHPVVKQMSAPLIRHELMNAEAHEDAVNRQTQRLLQLGYHEQVPIRSDAANV